MNTHSKGSASLIAVIVAALALGGGYLIYKDSNDVPDDAAAEGAMMEKDSSEDAMMPRSGEVMEPKDEVMMEAQYTGAALAGSASPLLDFTKADYEKAIASGKPIALYFYANWCPVCRAEFPKMQGAFDELSGDDIIGFRVNYNDSDTDADEVALARKFGVAYQHTKVFLKNGEQILKSPESWDEARYAEELGKLITS